MSLLLNYSIGRYGNEKTLRFYRILRDSRVLSDWVDERQKFDQEPPSPSEKKWGDPYSSLVSVWIQTGVQNQTLFFNSFLIFPKSVHQLLT